MLRLKIARVFISIKLFHPGPKIAIKFPRIITESLYNERWKVELNLILQFNQFLSARIFNREWYYEQVGKGSLGVPFRLTSCKFVFALDRSYKTAPLPYLLCYIYFKLMLQSRV